jgi:uncharacterized protein YggL (DUF469 family)
MKKRLRKKRRLDEFSEYGFQFVLKVKSALDEKGFDDFLDNMVLDFVEKNGLYCCGGVNVETREMDFHVDVGVGEENAREKMELFKKWLQNSKPEYDLEEIRIVNSWYPDETVIMEGKNGS